MRISDWSSDVCSSDLLNHVLAPAGTRSDVGTGLSRATCLVRVPSQEHGCLLGDLFEQIAPAGVGCLDQAQLPVAFPFLHAKFAEAGLLKIVIGLVPAQEMARSEERRVGKECVSTCRSRWSPSH